MKWNSISADIQVVYHLQKISRNSGSFVDEIRRFGSFQWKISAEKGICEKLVLLSSFGNFPMEGLTSSRLFTAVF